MRNRTSYTKAMLTLIRVKISLLVTFSAAIGFLITGVSFQLYNFIGLVTGVFTLSAGSCALNQFQERDLDKRMKRTQGRPLPSGLLSPNLALLMSIAFIISGFIILHTVDSTSALLGMVNVFFYNAMYTPLKVLTPLSIMPGAVVGAVPPVMGWCATGMELAHPTILFVALFMFLWQFPHFWLLLIVYAPQYEKAGYATLSKYLNTKQLKYLVYYIALLTTLFVLLYPFFGFNSSKVFFGVMLCLNAGFIALLHRLLIKSNQHKSISQAFRLINIYMAGMLVVILVFGTLLIDIQH